MDYVGTSGLGAFGKDMAIGDLNGDGLDDLVIGAPDRVIAGTAQFGAVYVFYGGSIAPTRPDTMACWPDRSVHFGRNGFRIADVNGDGYKDLVVGSDVEAPGNKLDGIVDVYRGGPGWKLDPLHPDQRLGNEILPLAGEEHSMRNHVSILDVNNDGTSDLFVIDHYKGYAYFGGPDGFRSRPDRVFLPPDSGWYRFAQKAHRIGDINGDGFDDFAVNAWQWTGFSWHVGLLFLFLGGTDGMGLYPEATAYNPAGGRWIGECIVNIGDIDGDGLNDFATSYMDNSGDAGYAIFAGYPWERTSINPDRIPEAAAIQAYPNPFRDYTTFVVRADAARASDAVVYNVFGREIRRIPVRLRGGDETTIAWDGRDSRGMAMPAGIYFFVMETSTGLMKGKIVKLE